MPFTHKSLLGAAPRRSPPAKATTPRRGVTMLELLIVLGIVALLVALIIPAVQYVRAGAHLTACKSNLAQIGRAIMQYEATFRVFPHGELNGYSFAARILPFLEHKNTYEKIEFGWHPTAPFSRVVPVGDRISVFLCPSDSLVWQRRSNWSLTNYAANGGTFRLPRQQKHNGAFAAKHVWERFPRVPAPFLTAASFHDGLAHTAGVSELLIADNTQHRLRGVWTACEKSGPFLGDFDSADGLSLGCMVSARERGMVGHSASRGRNLYSGNTFHSWYNHIASPNSPSCTNCGAVGHGTYAAVSLHQGGVNVMFMDGHVRFVHQNIALHVWREMGSRFSD